MKATLLIHVQMRQLSCLCLNPLQDNPHKRDPTLAPSGDLRTAAKVFRPGLRLARSVRWHGSLDQPLLRIRLRYTDGLVRTAIVFNVVVGVGQFVLVGAFPGRLGWKRNSRAKP